MMMMMSCRRKCAFGYLVADLNEIKKLDSFHPSIGTVTFANTVRFLAERYVMFG